MKESNLLISVVVCTYNRGNVLAFCLKSLACQTFDCSQYEVLVVDNNSSDNTQLVAKEFVSLYPNFRLVAEPEQGLSHARNKGLAEVQGEYVAFIDDEARAPESWLETAANIVHSNTPDIFGGPAAPIFDCVTPSWYKEDYGIRGDMGDTGWLKEGFIIGTNIFFRKALLEEYGGFDPDLGMKGDSVGYHEETALVFRAFRESRKVYFSREMIVHDLMPDYKLSLAYFFYSKYKVGYDGVKLWGVEYPEDGLPQLLEIIDQTMNSFDFALRKRDTSKYEFPENYIVEELASNFQEIGERVKFFKGSKDFESLDTHNREISIDEEVLKVVSKNGFLKTLKSLIMHIVKAHFKNFFLKR